MEKRKFLARIAVFNGGKYGRMGEYTAEIIPEFFKNGTMKKSGFTVLKVVEETKKGYNYGNAIKSETIKEIIKEL